MDLNRRAFLKKIAAGAAVGLGAPATNLLAAPSMAAPPSSSPTRPPNIVIILADDLGWDSVGFHGGSIPTPHIDRIAREGVEIERFYTCPICSPTRAGLLTGRYPIRFGMQAQIMFQNSAHGIPEEEETLPRMLGRAGYKRRGIVGKWHLGHAEAKYRPLGQGFTYAYGNLLSSVDYFDHTKFKKLDWWRQEAPVEEEGYVTDLCADDAVRFIREAAAEKEPFFLYLPFQAPHVPLQAPEDLLERFPDLPEQEQVYAAMVVSLDNAVGRVLDALDERKIADDTLVWFLSDNGGGGDLHNAPLRGHKATLFEGGIRVPCAIRWPKEIEGGRNIEGPMAYIDMLPTIARIAGATPGNPQPLDGVDLLQSIRGQDPAPPRDLFQYIRLTPEDESLSLTTPEWKLIYRGPNILAEAPDATNAADPEFGTFLFGIAGDPYEERNMAPDRPDVVQTMLGHLKKFRALNPGWTEAGGAEETEQTQ